MKDKRAGKTSSTVGTDNIRCPFFVAHSQNEIVCEGIIQGTRISQKFRKGEEKKFQQQCFCECQYKKCEIYCSIQHWRWQDD